jgi:pimeloyl-ACP methyl ester carboxylesterase
MNMREASVNGIRIYFREFGSGQPLVLLHGSPQSSLAWRKLIPMLSSDRTIIVPDLRGYGLSDKPGHGYGIFSLADDVRQLVRELKLGPVDLVGHDLGAITAYVYAAQHMDEVRRLGILEAPILGVPSPSLEPVLASYRHLALYAHPRLPELLITGRERDYLAEFFRSYGKIDAIEDDAIDEYARYLSSPGGIGGMVGVYREIMSELPKLARLTTTKLTMPVWAVGGDQSMAMGPYEQFSQLAHDVCGGIVIDCGHWVAEEQPAQVAEELNAFLS